MDRSEFELLKKTQLALLKSNFVLSFALCDPKINSLPLIHDQADPIEWLQEHLAVQFPENGAILSISLSGSEAQSKELVQLVDAVVKAYKDEVIVESRVRVLGTRDLLAKNLENFDKELKQKKATYLDIAREAGKTEAYGSNIAQQLTAKRLELTEGEIMRLETELAVEPNADGTKRKAIQERISQLKKIQEKLMNEVRTLSMRSSELESRRHDLQRLQHIADELSATVEKMDIDASCPDRIHQIQAAAISQD